MRDIKALLENQGADDIIDDDDEDDDDTVTGGDNDGDGGGIRMESGPQQILLNAGGRDRDDINEMIRGRNRGWSIEDDDEEEEQEQLLRKRSASSRKNVHFR